MNESELALGLMRGIHRELIVLNWQDSYSKSAQRRLFTLIDAVEKINEYVDSDPNKKCPENIRKNKEKFIEEMANLISQGYVEG